MSEIERIAAGTHLELVRRERWEYARRRQASGVVAIFACTARDEVILTEQWRIPVQARVIDLPAGLVGDGADANEPLQVAAARELTEETGFVAETWMRITSWATSPGLTDEVVTLLSATAAIRTSRGGGVEGEDIQVHLVPRGELLAWLSARSKSGALIDPKVYVGLQLCR